MKTRVVTAVAVLVSAWVHFDLWREGYRDLDVVGPAFLLNAVAGVLIALLLVGWRHWLPLFLAAGFGASTLGAFVLSTTVGFFGVHETWSGADVLVAAAAEVVALVGGAVGLWREWSRRSAAQSQDRAPGVGAHLD